MIVLLSFLCLSAAYVAAQVVDLSNVTVVVPKDADEPERAAVQLLVDEVEHRTSLHWNQASVVPLVAGTSRIEIGRVNQLPSGVLPDDRRPDPKAEAFRIGGPDAHTIVIAGHDDRGVLYGIGYLLRHLDFSPMHARLARPLHVSSSPQLAVRGHQLGYRFKNNTYDAWTPEQFEQYIRDLAVFGANTIELLPPVTDDAPTSPLFPLPPLETMQKISGILKKYGLRCSVYYPMIAGDYSKPEVVESELHSWGEVFKALPQLDELFVPGGDPGHTDPVVLFSYVARVAEVLHQSHPHATVWISGQGFTAEQMDRFYALVNTRPAWLAGVVVGPQSRDGLETQRRRIIRGIPVRFYPDIGHVMHCQFPIMDWDPAFALTEGREAIDPRPDAEASMVRHYAPMMNGFVTYSEGVNDDVNKVVWTMLGWSGQTSTADILSQYARYFLGSDGFQASKFADGILELEQNWNGSLERHTFVDATLKNFQSMEHAASNAQAQNWRFEAALYRAYMDAYERHRLIAAGLNEQRAMSKLAMSTKTGSLHAMDDAEVELRRTPADTETLQRWRASMEDIAGRLFHHIGLQLSVTKYGASAIERGANLDSADIALNDRAWLSQAFVRVRALPSEEQRLRELDAIVHWSDPGLGGFYDDLGNPGAEPHLVRGPGPASDPALFNSAQDGIADHTPNQGWKLSEISYAGALYDRPLELKYDDLDAAAHYKLRVVYAGEDFALPLTLIMNGQYVIHESRPRRSNPELIEFSIPGEATRSGKLDLQWTRPKGLGGSGRGLQVAEVWLIREPE